jgi:hypothetical protein
VHLGLIIVFDDLNLDFILLPVDFDVELRGSLLSRTSLASVISAFAVRVSGPSA